jgi:protease IV
MKEFFKFMFASMLGFFLTFLLLSLFMIGMIASIATMADRDTADIDEQSVLHLQLATEIVDRGGRNPFESFDFMSLSLSKSIGLNDLLENIEKAKADDNIEGIYLDLSIVPAGWSTVHEIRQALDDFRESGKFVMSYGETYLQNAYYLGSVANEIYLHPEGMIDFRGLNSELFFLKDMLGRLGIDPQVIRHGEYKSAGEPFFLEKMSPENREQTQAYISAIWNNITADIATSRGLTVNHINEVADGMHARSAARAMEWDMIDGIAFYDEVLDMLRSRLGLEDDDEINFVSLEKYANAPRPESISVPSTRDRIAVVYASGNIVSGEGNDQVIGSDRIAKAIREARLNDNVKAIVFRINSPGGSALASDVILREVKLAALEKPVIASMGDVAASGGYYIACGADHIIANPTTITGSIGVFGMIPNMQEFFNEKIGIAFDNVKTNQFADFGSITRPLTQAERQMVQGMISEVYDTFIGHVSEGRGLPLSVVDELGAGRVWSGAEAKQNGLIDEFGGLQTAIHKAAELAELEEYRIMEYPTRKDFLTQILEDFGGVKDRMIQKELGSTYAYYKQLQNIEEMTGILTRLPYDIKID